MRSRKRILLGASIVVTLLTGLGVWYWPRFIAGKLKTEIFVAVGEIKVNGVSKSFDDDHYDAEHGVGVSVHHLEIGMPGFDIRSCGQSGQSAVCLYKTGADLATADRTATLANSGGDAGEWWEAGSRLIERLDGGWELTIVSFVGGGEETPSCAWSASYWRWNPAKQDFEDREAKLEEIRWAEKIKHPEAGCFVERNRAPYKTALEFTPPHPATPSG